MSVTEEKWALVITAAQSRERRITGQDTNVTYMDTILRTTLRELGIEIEVTE